MDKRNILKHVDHTLLKAYATWEDIVELCDEAILYQTASVCRLPMSDESTILMGMN